MKLFISKTFFLLGVLCYLTSCTVAQEEETQQNDNSMQSEQTLAVAQSFLQAAGSGDMETLQNLMTDDFVWHNEGDANIPWIGNWEGKEKVLNEFLPAFGGGLKTTSWTTDYSFANGDQAVFMGSMSAIANNTGADTGTFSWAVRVHVVDGKVKSWNWFEDSYAVSRAYSGN
ncbi:MAG: nuclear transport factor 2 family protein [Bacteroidota bacterium]